VGAPGAKGELSVGGKNFSIPEHATLLLQQAFEAMKEPRVMHKQEAEVTRMDKGKEVSKTEPMVQQSKLTAGAEEPESSKQAEVLYCYRCETKGHAIEVCHATMYCNICASHDLVRPRCPKFRAVKPSAMLCGYAVERLGFFHIPHELSQKQCSETRTALIRVLDGNLSIHNVISELERLIPGSWIWNVEDTRNNTFKTVFPSKSELMRMVE
jgi:hypothetical protein